ncbi:MAG: glutamate-1-semialdehyde 2,1-aminomutase [Balneolales bacterium]
MYENSKALFQRAQTFIPGGVNSPVRAFKGVGGTPIFIKKAKGSVLYDEDGNQYIDFMASWGPMILGHAWQPVVEAVRGATLNSTSFGAPSESEVALAELIVKMVPGLEKIRMVNSGTEACMSAIRVARGYTERDKIIKFEGCYHGHADSFLIKAGSGVLTLGKPDSPGVTEGVARDTLTASFNNLESVRRLFEGNRGEVAAVIIEPVAGNMGCIPPEPGFLEGLRKLCDEHNSVLIFDEVMCGFRVDPGGARQRYNVEPDLVTYGKIIGAGLPVGAFGGKSGIMDVIAPDGPVYQAGTLSGNPLAMAAGLALLTELHTNRKIYAELEEKSSALQSGLANIFDQAGIAHTENRVGSMLGIFFARDRVTDFQSATKTDVAFFKRFFHEMLLEGVYLPPSAFETIFISHSLTSGMIDQTLSAAGKAARKTLAHLSVSG